MSSMHRGPLVGSRMPIGMRPPPPRFGRPMPGMPRMPLPPHPMGPWFGCRPRLPPPRRGPIMRPVGPPLPHFGPRSRGPPPLMLGSIMGPGGMGPCGPPMVPRPRILSPQASPHIRPRYPPGNGNIKSKMMNNAKKAKLEELEMTKKPWITDDIRSEIQKKNKLYTKARKNKDTKEWDQFKEQKSKVSKMIKEAQAEYFAKNPDQVELYQHEQEYNDERDENYKSTEDEESYYCEICDREFATDVLFAEHKQSHKVCGIDGCTFSAHPKLVEKHISMQHHTGLWQKLKDLSSPEAIQKWRSERIRKYPTKTNIDLKKTQDLEKQQRGEIIAENKSNTRTLHSRKTVQTKKRRCRKPRPYLDKISTLPEEEELYRGLRPFRGIGNLTDDNSNQEIASLELLNESPNSDKISDEEDDLPETSPKVPMKLVSSLVADYSSDSDNDAPEEVPIKRMKVDESQDILPETSSKAETKIVPTPNELQPTTNKPKKQLDRQNVVQKKNFQSRTRPSLLKKLLSQAIIHERNYICQCLKYIVDNNFFE